MTTPIRLVANDKHEIHPPIQKPSPIKPVEYDVPVEATRGGDLTLTFSAPAGLGSAGRGNQIAEVWLLRKVMDAPWESPVRRRLRESLPVFGCTITTGSLDMAARAATAGFHFLWLELEHSPLTLETVRNIVLATRDLPAVPFARVPETEAWSAKRVLDAGVHGVVFPFVSTPALARQAADACRYPPAGRRGSGASLATACWPDPDGYYDSADRNIVVVVVVEQASALDHLDDIAATPGVDVVFVGTGDLSFSLGLRGQQRHPRSKRRRPTCSPPRAATARSPAVRPGRSTRRSATSIRAFCFSRRRPSWRCSRQARSSFSGRTASGRCGASARCTRPGGQEVRRCILKTKLLIS